MTKTKLKFQILSVVILLSLPWTALAGGAQKRRPPAPVTEPIETIETVDPASSRVIWGPTALPNPRKGVRFTAFDLGLWDASYQMNEELSFGLQGVPPLGIFILGGVFRYAHAINPKLHIGFFGQAGMVTELVTHKDWRSFYYGGGPILTIGDHRYAFNFSLLNYGAKHENSSGYAFVPNFGCSVAMAKHLKFNLEAFSFNAPRQDFYGRAWAVLYGIRFFGAEGKFFGDIAFVTPIFPNVKRFYRWAPLGIPLLTLGYAF